MKGRF